MVNVPGAMFTVQCSLFMVQRAKFITPCSLFIVQCAILAFNVFLMTLHIIDHMK